MVVSVHDIHASVLASAGEEDYDMNLLELPGDGEKDNVCIQTKLKGEPNGEIYLSFSRKKVPKGAFAGRLHVTVHRVEGFRDKSGLLGRTDPFVSVKLGAGKPRQTKIKNNAGGTADFNETLTFMDKGLFDSMLRLRGVSLSQPCAMLAWSANVVIVTLISTRARACHSVMDSGTVVDHSMGEVAVNLDLLEIPEDGHHKHIWQVPAENQQTGGLIEVSLSRELAPAGAFAGLLHVTIHSIEGFDDKVGLVSMDTTDPYVKIQLMDGETLQTAVKDNAGGHNVDFNETFTFSNKGLLDSLLTVTVMDSNTLVDQTLGSVTLNLDQLGLPDGGETEKAEFPAIDANSGNVAGKEGSAKIFLSFSRKEAPEGSFDGVIHVTVCRIEGFAEGSFLNKNDPYVTLQLGSKQFKTTVKSNAGGKAVWNETFSFSKQLFDNLLRLCVFDKDTVTQDDMLGAGNIDLHTLESMPAKGVDGKDEVPVQTHHNGKPAGTVMLKFSRKN